MMRWSLLLALLVTVPVGAQTILLEDSEGDATARAGGAAALPGGTYPTAATDLTGFAIDEAPQTFTFRLQVQDLQPESEVEGDVTYYDVDFQHGDTAFRVEYQRQYLGQGAQYGANVQAFDGGRQRYVPISFDGDLDIDTGSGTMSYTVARDLFLDGNGTAPTLGRSFSLFRAFSYTSSIGIQGPNTVRVDDSMPDSGFGALDYAIQLGLKQTGHARLWSDHPVRASNGEQATFVYYVEAQNLDPESDHFTLTVEGVPEGWTVTLPADAIRVPGNTTQPFPVLVSTPFGHQHGAFASFVLKLTSQRDGTAVGQIQMGIRYLEIPQPAGHHDRVWFHARPDPGNTGIVAAQTETPAAIYMNAREDDENNDDSLEVPPTRSLGGPGQQRYEWDVFLEPGLELGLDFDLDRTGFITTEFTSDVPFPDAVLSGRLSRYTDVRDSFNQVDGKETILGELASTNPQQLDGATGFESVLTLKPEADLVAYVPDSALVLHLSLTTTDMINSVNADPILPRMLPSGDLLLPLFEYRDPVEHVFNALAGISLEPQGKAQKFVNPGETILLNLTLTNDGAVDDVFTLRVNGTNEAWARILGDTEVFVPTGASRPVIVAVNPSKDALDGDVADLIVTAASAAEPATTGQARVVAIVDDLLDRNDESHLLGHLEAQLTEDKDSPGPALPLLLVGLALVAFVRAKRS